MKVEELSCYNTQLKENLVRNEKDRLKILNELQSMNDAQGKAISHLMLGTKQRILIDGQSWKNPAEMAGKTDNNRVVDVKVDKSFMNQFVDVTITEVTSKRLRGELI